MPRATIRRRDLDLDRIRVAIEAAERRTSAEIVVSIAPFFIGRVWRAAQRVFLQFVVDHRRGRSGVLVFVVPSRRQVVVLADETVVARMDESLWHVAAARIATAFARGNGTAGLVEEIESLARALSEYFPRRVTEAHAMR